MLLLVENLNDVMVEAYIHINHKK